MAGVPKTQLTAEAFDAEYKKNELTVFDETDRVEKKKFESVTGS